MRTGRYLILFWALLNPTASFGRNQPGKDDLAKLQGTWLTVSFGK
jgi:hypothetical protein